MNIRIRLMKEEDLHHVNALYNSTYGNIRPDENFAWEFFNGPWGKAIYVIAEDLDKENNKIIGTQCAIPMKFCNSQGLEVLTAKSEDTYVDPNYRGQKLFEKMYTLLFEECSKVGINYIWGFTYAKKPFLKLGFEIPFDTIQAIYVKKPIKAFKYLASLNPSNSFFDKMKIFVGCVVSFLKAKVFASYKKVLIIEGNSYWSELKKSIHDNEWTLIQDPSYLKWRVFENPFLNDYSIYKTVSNANLGYCILNNRPEGFGYIEDFNIEKNNSENTSFISSCLTQHFSIYNPSLYRFWGFNNSANGKAQIELLHKIGFTFIKNKGTSFVWKKIGDTSNVQILPSELRLSRIYTQGNR